MGPSTVSAAASWPRTQAWKTVLEEMGPSTVSAAASWPRTQAWKTVLEEMGPSTVSAISQGPKVAGAKRLLWAWEWFWRDCLSMVLGSTAAFPAQVMKFRSRHCSLPREKTEDRFSKGSMQVQRALGARQPVWPAGPVV